MDAAAVTHYTVTVTVATHTMHTPAATRSTADAARSIKMMSGRARACAQLGRPANARCPRRRRAFNSRPPAAVLRSRTHCTGGTVRTHRLQGRRPARPSARSHLWLAGLAGAHAWPAEAAERATCAYGGWVAGRPDRRAGTTCMRCDDASRAMASKLPGRSAGGLHMAKYLMHHLLYILIISALKLMS
jgi:hypothetical protein